MSAEPVDALLQRANTLVDARDAGEAVSTEAVVAELLAAIEGGIGDGPQRLALGEALGRLGDPRLRLPAQPDYWARVEADGFSLDVGRYPVTNAEFQLFVRDGGFEDERWWDAEGRSWKKAARRLWPELAARDAVSNLVIPNQPVVGITWWEACAYARFAGARLPTFEERLEVFRGPANKPYPWGEPFGRGNSNTLEEVLGKPSAVGLFRSDCTPDGVFDMAGNVAEWTADSVGADRVVHPGSWQQPSMASWAKARNLVPARTRSADLGFRLVRDPR